MDDQNQAILNAMAETRSSLTEKLEALETQVAGKVQPVADAVERATEAAAEMVENVKETVHEVTEKVGETVQSVSSAFDFRRHYDQYPWVVLSLASTAGCMLGYALAPRSGRAEVRHRPLPPAAPPPPPQRLRAARPVGDGFGSVAAGESQPVEAPRQEGWFGEEWKRLKALAIGTAMGALRDLARQSLPNSVGERLADEIDLMTSRLGAEPFREPVLSDPEERESSRERKEPMAGDRNRMRSNGPGPVMN